ncbi:hypothetical protein M3Y95_00266100 [Aphelenchoides besseyi]|nr:hypothetical protein M3Y95_00266100 [Aphelenchoides besseyi]
MGIEVQLAAVTDAERFKLIDLFREQPVLWNREVGLGTREAVSNAWTQIAESISSPDRQFPVELVQKITKNLRDQYVRLQKRGHKTSWKFYSTLSFLGNPQPCKRTNQLEKTRPLENVDLLMKSSRLPVLQDAEIGFNQSDYLSLALLSDLRLPSSTTNMVFDPTVLMKVVNELLKTCSSTKQLFSSDLLNVAQTQRPATLYHSDGKQSDSNKHESTFIEVQLKDVQDTDRFKLIELYRQQPILWLRRNETREETAKAWTEIVESVSTSTRRFSLGLVQKLIKNMRDQYIRNLRRRTSSSWKFYSSLSFLEATIPPPLPKVQISAPQPRFSSSKDCDRLTSSRKRSTSFSTVIEEAQSKKWHLNDKTEEFDFESFKQTNRESGKNVAFQSITNLLLSNS